MYPSHHPHINLHSKQPQLNRNNCSIHDYTFVCIRMCHLCYEKIELNTYAMCGGFHLVVFFNETNKNYEEILLLSHDRRNRIIPSNA